MKPGEHEHADDIGGSDRERGEHPTDEKERIQQDEPHDGRVRERGANTGGGKLRPDNR